MRRRVDSAIVALIVSAFVLAGCSRSSAPGSSVTSGPAKVTTSQTAPSSPSTWSQEEAQKKYLAYVAPGNKLVAQLNNLIKQNATNLSPYRHVCGQIANDDDALARKISAGRWPTNVQPVAARFVGALARDRAGLQACAVAYTTETIAASIRSADKSAPVAEEMRIALGLPGTK